MDAVSTEALQPLLAILRGSGAEPPRRATIHPDTGSICCVMNAPGDCREVPVLSALCEHARHLAGLAVYPRDTADLLKMCLERNPYSAWQELYNDVKTGYLDWARAHVVLETPGYSHMAVAALVTTKDPVHVMLISESLTALLDTAPEPIQAAMGTAMASSAHAVVDVLARLVAFVRRESKEAVMSSFGRMLGRCKTGPEELGSLLEPVLNNRGDTDMVHLFIHTPNAILGECMTRRPELARAAIERVARASASTRYPLLALLARAVSFNRALLKGSEKVVLETVTGTLAQTKVDARVMLVASVLVQAVMEDLDPLSRALAKALERVSVSYITLTKQKPS
jgi:hypothetical protein